MPTFTQKEMVADFEKRHGQGVQFSDSDFVAYEDGSSRTRNGGGFFDAESLDVLSRAKNKQRYWQTLLDRNQATLHEVRQRLRSFAGELERTGRAPDTQQDEAELKRLTKELKAAGRGLAAAEEEVRAALPPRLQTTVGDRAMSEASRLRTLLNRTKA